MIVTESLVAGMEAEIIDDIVHFVGWSHVPSIGGEMEERRVVERFAMHIDTARECCQRVHGLLFGTSRH
jgi:hypothetical protein